MEWNWTIVAAFFGDLIIWTVIAVVAYFILFRGLRSLVGKTRFEVDNIVLRIVRIPLLVAIVAYGFVNAFRELRCPEPYGSLGTNAYVVTLIAAGVYLVWRIVREVVLRWLTNHAAETESRVDDLVIPLLGTVGPLIAFLVASIAILQYIGVNVAVLATSIGIIGLVIGLAFQDSLSNLFSGIYLMIDPAFVEYDLIRIEDEKIYSVEKVGLRMTCLYDMDSHACIYVPNSNLTKSRIANITKPTIDMKARMHVTMPATTPAEIASEIVRDAVVSHRNTLDSNGDKLSVLRKRIEKTVCQESERTATLFATISQLEGWLKSDAGNDAAYPTLHAVRREMTERLDELQAALRMTERLDELQAALRMTERLDELQAALRSLPRNRIPHGDLERVHATLMDGDTGPEMEEIDEERMARIYKAFAIVKGRFSAQEIAPFEAALDSLDQLDRRESELETSIEQNEQARENELDRLMATLVWTGDWVAEELISQGNPKEGARVSLWVRNMAVVYAYSEVEESLDGLDRELTSIIQWLRELEAGGLTKVERARIRMLFGAWGGLQQLEKRRVGELRRRILRWVEWKEKAVLDPGEHDRLVAAWERKLRALSRRLRNTALSDEEALDSSLTTTEHWLHGVNFIERLEEWKLPTVDLKAFDGDKLDYTVTFYIDDIKQQHFEREGFVRSDILADLCEACRRQGIEGAVAQDA
jgi:small-conductance mechanosensitive channel